MKSTRTTVVPNTTPLTGVASPAGPLRLGYEPVGSIAKATARHVRLAMLWLGATLLGVVLLIHPVFEVLDWLGVGLYGTPVSPIDLDKSNWRVQLEFLVATGAYLAVCLLAQWFFLLPRGRMSFRLTHKGRPMSRAVWSAALIAMLVSAGFIATLLELLGRWQPITVSESTGAGGGYQRFYFVWLIMGLLWAGWALLFHHLWRNLDHRTAVSRTTRALLAGTILELLVAGPAHAMHDRDDLCYCARGSYTGLVFGGTALLWLFGPGVVLLLLRERRRAGPRV